MECLLLNDFCNIGLWPSIVQFLSLHDTHVLAQCSHEFNSLFASEIVLEEIKRLHSLECSKIPFPFDRKEKEKDNVLGHWRFNFWEGGISDTVIDCSGHHRHMKLKGELKYTNNGVGVEFPERKVKFMDRNYPGCELDLKSSKVFSQLDTITVEAILKPNIIEKNNSQEYNFPIVSQHGPASGWELRFTEKPSFFVTLYKEHFQAIVPKAIVLEDRWYHVAGAFDGCTVSLYLDGVCVAQRNVRNHYEKNTISALITKCDLPLSIGGNASWKERCQFNGTIKEVRVCSKALQMRQMLCK